MDYEELLEYHNFTRHVDLNTLSPLQHFQTKWFVNSLWILLYTLTVIITTGGNVIVIWTVFSNRVLRTCTNYLIAGMAISDTLHSVIRAIPSVYAITTDTLLFGSAFCFVQQFIGPFATVATSNTLVAIAWVQRLVSLRPNQKQCRLRDALHVLLVIWTVALLIAMPNALWSEFITFMGKRYCHRHLNHVYDVILLVLRYIGPVVGLLTIYGNVLKYMSTNMVPEKTRQMVYMNVTVAVVFIVGWISDLYFMFSLTFEHIFAWSENTYLFIIWVTYFSAMLKPVIYVRMSQEFRYQIKKTFPRMFMIKGEVAFQEMTENDANYLINQNQPC